MDFENKINYKEIGKEPDFNSTVCRITNNKEILIKTWLPTHDLLQLISRIVNRSVDEYDYCNPCRVKIVREVEMVLACSNVEVPDYENADICEIYDYLYANKIIDAVADATRATGLWDIVMGSVNEVVDSVYKYSNSARGIIRGITSDLEDVQFDVEAIQEKLGNPENLALLKDILTKLG
jgi:hypothetical protein